MSGRYVELEPGRYTLAVTEGDGPAGVRRGDGGDDVAIGIGGGRVEFRVATPERVFYWWRGPEERPGVRLLGVWEAGGLREEAAAWPTGTTG